MNFKMIFILIFLFLLVVFTLQNYEVIQIDFIFWEFYLSRALVIFTTFAVGLLTGYLFSEIKRKK